MAYSIRALIITILTSCLLASCDNELQVAAEWEDVTIVYGVVGASYDTNYIRIQRAYLDPVTGALEFAREFDSLYYDSLEVYLTEFHNGVEKNSYRLQKVGADDVGRSKDSGLFHYAGHQLFIHTEPIGRSNSANRYDYRLTVLNPVTGKIAQANTTSIGWAEIDAPLSENTDELLITADSNFRVVASYKEGVFARAYDMSLRIRVLEVDRDDPSKQEIVEMDWPLFRERKTRSLRGLEDVVQIVPGKAFFNLLQSNLDSTRNVRRYLYDCDLYAIGIGDEFYTFLNVNEPSIGIVQKKPEYSNIENGYGIFSSRYVNTLANKHFHDLTKRAVQLSDKTAHLGFE